MGSPDCAGERRKSVRQIKSTKKKIGSSVTREEENAVHIAGNDLQSVKQEEVPQQIAPKPSYGWQHPAELNYFTPTDWSDTKIIHHLIAYAFDVPQKNTKNGQPFCQIVSMDGTKTVLPHGYRIPLMFLARFQWLSLKLVLSAANRQTEWEEYKFGILHVSRLCKQLLDSAQAALGAVDWDPTTGAKVKSTRGVDRKWRCPTFDRALVRYRLKWFISKPAQVKEFWTEYGEEEYDKDVVGLGWRGWALKGHKGFSLTEEEIQNGISAQQLMQGLKEKGGQWCWETEGMPVIEGGTDAWSLRYKALADIPSFGSTPNPTPISCLPLSSTTSSNVSSPNLPFKAPSTTAIPPKPVAQQPQTPASPSVSHTVSTPSSKSKIKNAFEDIMSIVKAAGVHLPTGTIQNGEATPSGASISAAAHVVPAGKGVSPDNEAPNRSVGDKRPGSPLEKEGPAKRSFRSSLSQLDSASASTVMGSETSDPEPPSFTPTLPSRPIKREPSLDPDVEVLHSAPSRFKRRASARNPQSSSFEDLVDQNGVPTSPTSSVFSNITKDEAARLMRANEDDLKPMVLELNSQKSTQSVSGEDDMVVDSNPPPLAEKPPSNSNLGNRPPLNVLPPRPNLSITSMVRTPTTTTTPTGSRPTTIPMITNLAKPSPTGTNPPQQQQQQQQQQQMPSPSSTQPSPHPGTVSKGFDYQRSIIQTQWQQPRPDSASQSPIVNGTPVTPGPGHGLSNQRFVPPPPPSPSPNQGGNTRMMEPLLPVVLEETLKKFAAEIKEAKEGISDVRKSVKDVKDVIRSEIKTGVSEVVRGEMQKINRGLDVGDVKREVQSGLVGLGSQLERGLQSYLTAQVASVVRTATREEVGKFLGESGTVRELLKGLGSRDDGVIEELRKELAKSREREQQMGAVLQEMRGELVSIREVVSRSGDATRTIMAADAAPPPSADPAPPQTSFLLLEHPLAHLFSDTTETDETDSFDGRIPGLTYPEPRSSAAAMQLQTQHGGTTVPPAARARSYSGTPMSMSPEIVLLESEPAEQKFRIPEPEPVEPPVAPERPPSPSLYEDVVDVKPVIIDGEAFLPNAAGEPTPLTAFPSPIPARSHRKFKKMRMMGGGEAT